MKRKEIKNLAEKIAKFEKIIETSDDPAEARQAQLEIIKLTSSVTRLEDFDLIDECVQDILRKNN